MGQFSRLAKELRRRRVLSAAAVYIVGAWVILQVADLAFESWSLPSEALRYVWIAAVVLFPLALIFGWRYDITTQGIVRTPEASGEAVKPLRTADYVILAAFVALIGYTGVSLVTWISESDLQTTQQLESKDIDPNSIAVLPFVTRSTEQDTDFFADGIHDDLLTVLANISSLKVISRTSVLEYRDTTRNLRQIGRELGAANILEGGIQRAGDSVRINVQLIRSETDEHLWAHTYDKEFSLENIFAIQSEIAAAIAEQLAMALSSEERKRIDQKPTVDLEAYRAFVKGKQRFATSSFETLREAAALFTEAIEIDPDYVLARIYLARTYSQLTTTGAMTVNEMIENGRAHIDHAVQLDPDNGFGQAVLANYESAAGADVDSVHVRMKRALVLNPNSVEILDLYADFLRTNNRNEEALVVIDQALELDPLSVTLYHDLGRASVSLGRFDEANAAFKRISQIDPENPYAAHGAAISTILGGQLAEAARWSDQAMAIDPADFENPATSVFIYGSISDWDMAQQRLDEALALGPNEPYPLAAQAYLLTVKGEFEKAVPIARTALVNRLEDRWRSEFTFLKIIQRDALLSGNYAEALAWYRQLIPECFADSPCVNVGNIGKAVDAAHLLKVSGETELADRILNEIITQYALLYTRGKANFPMGIASVGALALLSRKDEALSEFERLIDDGFRLTWRLQTEFNANHDSLRDDPRYQALVMRISDDLAAQVRAFAADNN